MSAYVKEHPDTLAVYCSDGRFTDAVEELVRSLGHPRLDVLCLPGGPALLDLGSAGFSALETMRTGATFLIRGHGTKHVVLVAHQGCGYYRERYRFETPDEIVHKQKDDLKLAASWITGQHAVVSIHAYFAKPQGGKVAFDPVVG